MSKQSRLVVAAAGLASAAVLVISYVVTRIPDRPLAVGTAIRVPPKTFEDVTVENLEPVTEQRHARCSPEPHNVHYQARWNKGSACQIGNENAGFDLIVAGFTDDQVLLRYMRGFHDHDESNRCPQGTLFLQSRKWVLGHLAVHEKEFAARMTIAKALGKPEAAALPPLVPPPPPEPPPVPKQIETESPIPLGPPAPPPPEPPPPPVPPPSPIETGREILLKPDFSASVIVRNPDGIWEQRAGGEDGKEFTHKIWFGKPCRVTDDGMNSTLTVLGVDGRDVLLRWTHPNWALTGADRICPDKVVFFKPVGWVKKLIANETAFKAERAKVQRILDK